MTFSIDSIRTSLARWRRPSSTGMGPDVHWLGRSLARFGWVLSLACVLPACTGLAPVNEPVEQVDATRGYQLKTLVSRHHPETLVILTFSGGGTRAAALSFGVLEELRRTPMVIRGRTGNFLEYVDVMTGASGGSFTALSYALLGERLFSEYEQRFLKRDVQGELLKRLLSPNRWRDLWSPTYGRSELAADFYDEILFGGATYGDLLKRDTPAVVVSGTDLSTGARFQFSQDDFDYLCSDLSKVRLSRAAAASSAVPVVLSPVTFFNYAGKCQVRMPTWVSDVSKGGWSSRPAGRALLRYRDILNITDNRKRPYLHIVDGGISDNLGLRGILEAFEEFEASAAFRREMNIEQLRQVVIISVNSRSSPSTDWDMSRTPPGFLSQLLQSSSVPIDHFSSESMELLKDTAANWELRRQLAILKRQLAGKSLAEAEAEVPKLSLFDVEISFDAIADPMERDYFMNLPTSFSLPDEAVDRLRALGARLLRESPEFQTSVKSINAQSIP